MHGRLAGSARRAIRKVRQVLLDPPRPLARRLAHALPDAVGVLSGLEADSQRAGTTVRGNAARTSSYTSQGSAS